MKLKYNFVVRKLRDIAVAVAVDGDNTKFSGVIKLNSTGEFVFNMLNTSETTIDDIITAVIKKYDVDKRTATQAVETYIKMLRKNGLIEEWWLLSLLNEF